MVKSYGKYCAVALMTALCITCASATRVADTRSPIEIENEKFLRPEKKDDEVFRVLLSSDRYEVSQLRYLETISRVADAGGDQYMCNEMKRHDKFDEAKESVMRLWIYPDSGKLQKIRPVKPTFLIEIDEILLEDMQRWSFAFPKKIVTPTRLDVKYRVVIQKKLSDDEIMKEMREMLREKRENR